MKGAEIFLMLGAAGTGKSSGGGAGFTPGLSSDALEEAGTQEPFGQLIARLANTPASGPLSAAPAQAPKPSDGAFFAASAAEQKLQAMLAKLEAKETLSAEDLAVLLQALLPLLQALGLSGDEKAQVLNVLTSEEPSGDKLQALFLLLEQAFKRQTTVAPDEASALDPKVQEAAERSRPPDQTAGEGRPERPASAPAQAADSDEEPALELKIQQAAENSAPPDQTAGQGRPERAASSPAQVAQIPASQEEALAPPPAEADDPVVPALAGGAVEPKAQAAPSRETPQVSAAPAPAAPRAEPDLAPMETVAVQLSQTTAPPAAWMVTAAPDLMPKEGLAKLLRQLQAEDPLPTAPLTEVEPALGRGELLSVFRRILQLVQRIVQQLSSGTGAGEASARKRPQGPTEGEAKLIQPGLGLSAGGAVQTPSAAPKPLPQVSVETLAPRVGEEVVKFVQITRAPGATTLKMQLVPPHLGALEVTISQAEEGVRIRFTVESPEARQVVCDQLPKMVQKLESHQVVLKEVEVEVAHDQEEPFAGTPHHSSADTSGREPKFTGKPPENDGSRGRLFAGFTPGGWSPTGYALGVNIYA